MNGTEGECDKSTVQGAPIPYWMFHEFQRAEPNEIMAKSACFVNEPCHDHMDLNLGLSTEA